MKIQFFVIERFGFCFLLSMLYLHLIWLEHFICRHCFDILFYYLDFSQSFFNKMKIAIIGQSQFGADVYKLLQKNGHDVVGVFTIPDVNGRADPLGRYL